ncbi:hypothetical protein ACU4GD_29370 [Cupriavidus basilensis]
MIALTRGDGGADLPVAALPRHALAVRRAGRLRARFCLIVLLGTAYATLHAPDASRRCAWAWRCRAAVVVGAWIVAFQLLATVERYRCALTAGARFRRCSRETSN